MGFAASETHPTGYPQLLRAFLVRHDAHMLKLAA